MINLDEIEARLADFNSGKRRDALARLAEAIRKGIVKVPRPGRLTNLHYHTFFSYNAYGYSPSRIAWEARKQGLEMAGTVDFDVLDSLDEFLGAGDLLDLKVEVGLETRVFIPEYEDRETNSPKEPGVSYYMGTGFVEHPGPGTSAHSVLMDMRRRAAERNRTMMGKINSYIPEVAIDYERDVLTLTPLGNATERHMLEAYDKKARAVFGEGDRLAEFWGRVLGIGTENARALIADPMALRESVRARLMKYGGIGYAAPEKGAFPLLQDVIKMIRDVRAIPTPTWLDGTSNGERDPRELLRFHLSQGGEILQLIPDRNWNVRDPVEREAKLENLRAVVEAAEELAIPLITGTEMNRWGQKFVDDLEGPYLAPYNPGFLRGAHVLYAHTLLSRTCGFGLLSEGATEVFGDDRARRNDFFAQIGGRPFPSARTVDFLRGLAGKRAAQVIDAVSKRTDW